MSKTDRIAWARQTIGAAAAAQGTILKPADLDARVAEIDPDASEPAFIFQVLRRAAVLAGIVTTKIPVAGYVN